MEEEAKAVGLDARLCAAPSTSTSPAASGSAPRRSSWASSGRPICILDEVDSGLDVDALGEVARRLQHDTTEWGVGLLAITHFNRFLVQLEADLVHVLVDGRIVATGDAALACSSSRPATPDTRTNTDPRRPARELPAGACRHLRNGAWYRSSPWRTVVRRATGRIAPPRSVAVSTRTRMGWPRSGVDALRVRRRRGGAGPERAWPTSRACGPGATHRFGGRQVQGPTQRQAQVEHDQEDGGGAVLVGRAHRRHGRWRVRLRWYRYNQINKVHINAEVAAAERRALHDPRHRLGQPGRGVEPGLRVGLGRDRAAQRRRAAVASDAVDQADSDRVNPARHRRLHAASGLSQFGTYNRINSSFNSGADQLVKTITANFGIPINHVVQVDFAGFQDAVNALGGIYLDFPYPAKDSYSGLDITTPGCQLLNGAQALAVARARHYEYYAHGYWQFDGTSDFGRIQRQDVFIRSLITSAKSKVNPLTVNAFIGSIHEGVTIDDGFGINELIGLALDYQVLRPVQSAGPDAPTEAANDFGDLGDVLTVQQPQAQQMLVNIFGSDLTTPTNPPPDAAGDPNPPPPITPTTVAPASPTTAARQAARPAAPRRSPRPPRRRPRLRSTPRPASESFTRRRGPPGPDPASGPMEASSRSRMIVQGDSDGGARARLAAKTVRDAPDVVAAIGVVRGIE